jgi:adenylate kinase family enzyme
MREDDRPERIANRLVVFRKKTASLIGWYEAQGLLLRVDGNGGTYAVVDQVAEAVMA